MMELAGYRDTSPFFADPAPAPPAPPAAPPPVDPNVLLAQAQTEQIRADIAKQAAELALEREKMVRADDRERDKVEADLLLRAEELEAKYGRIRAREKLGALNLAGELALSAGLFQEAVTVLTNLISEEERLQKSYYREGAAAMRAYALVELSDGAAAMADIVQIEDDLQMFWIDNVPMLTRAYLLKRVRALDTGANGQGAAQGRPAE